MSIPRPPLTIGIEEEYQLIDPVTRDLTGRAADLIAQSKSCAEPFELKPEFMRSQIEIGSEVCENVTQLREDLCRLRRATCQVAAEQGVAIAAASTHPFANWRSQQITDADRYDELFTDLQGVARQLLIFGMHVHVGFGHHQHPILRDVMIEVMNQARYFIPHLLALSTSSPFWQGENTGLKSYRNILFEMLPRTGIPPTFSSWDEYKTYEKRLGEVGSFGDRDRAAKIWWDIRPHPKFDTLEFRIADICTTVDEAVCLVALFQAICAKLLKLYFQNMSWRSYRSMYINENKWRAVRYGISKNLIDFGRSEERLFSHLAEELLLFIDDVVDELGSRSEAEYIHTILKNGTSADRQLRVYAENGGEANHTAALHAVVDHLIAETKIGF